MTCFSEFSLAYHFLSLFSLPLSFKKILILLIKLREPAGLRTPPHLRNFLTGSIKGWRRGERGTDREGRRERSERGWTEGGFMAALLCFLSVSWLCEWSSSDELLTPRYLIRLQSYLWIPAACARTRTHAVTLHTAQRITADTETDVSESSGASYSWS